jgi:TonB family protein
VVSKKPSKPEEKGDTAPRKKRIELSFARDTERTSKNSAADARRQTARAEAARSQYATKVGSVLGAIGAGISSGTSIEAFGPGGEATADYAQFVEFFYRRAWSQPAEVDDDLATVKATVVIRRDGTVESFRITKRSGNATLDNSVQRLENLRSVAPFPEGARDERRTFVLNFNLKAEP